MRRSKAPAAIGGATLTLALVLTGCSTDTPEAKPTYDAPVDMTLTTWASDPAVHEMWQMLAAEFRAENPEFGELTIQQFPADEYVANMAIQLSAGDAPDLGWVRDQDAAAWLASGALYDISALRDDPAWAWDDVLPNLVESFEGENGELWAYPAVNTVHPVFYNKTAFEAAGVETPHDLVERGEWTWEALRELAKQVTASQVVPYGFDLTQYNFNGMPTFFHRAFEADYWPNGNTCGLTEEPTVKTIEFIRGMMFDDKSFKTPGTTPNFTSGDTAMAIAAPSYQSQLADAAFEWDLVPQPKGTGTYMPTLSQASMGVWAKGEAPELATRFLGYLTGPRGAEVQAKVFLPARAGDQAKALAIMADANPRVSKESIEAAVFAPMSAAVADTRVERLPEINSAIKPILDGLWTPDADVRGVLKNACAAAEPLL